MFVSAGANHIASRDKGKGDEGIEGREIEKEGGGEEADG